MFVSLIGKSQRNLESEENLLKERAKDQYYFDHARKWLQISSTWCITLCIIILAIGFAGIFAKYIY